MEALVWFCSTGVRVSSAHVCVYTTHTHTPSAHSDHKKASDPLELELRMTGSCHVGAGDLKPSSLQEQPVPREASVQPSPGTGFDRKTPYLFLSFLIMKTK